MYCLQINDGFRAMRRGLDTVPLTMMSSPILVYEDLIAPSQITISHGSLTLQQ
jgi:hypothetical protein